MLCFTHREKWLAVLILASAGVIAGMGWRATQRLALDLCLPGANVLTEDVTPRHVRLCAHLLNTRFPDTIRPAGVQIEIRVGEMHVRFRFDVPVKDLPAMLDASPFANAAFQQQGDCFVGGGPGWWEAQGIEPGEFEAAIIATPGGQMAIFIDRRSPAFSTVYIERLDL